MPRVKTNSRGLWFPTNDEKSTPKGFLEELNKSFQFDFDPCPMNADFNGLAVEWGKSNFVNPPFSNIEQWVKKAVVEMKKGKMSVFLIPLRTNSLYWETYIYPNCTGFYTLPRSLCFGDHRKPLPIPLGLVIFDPTKPKIWRSEEIGGISAWCFEDGPKFIEISSTVNIPL